MRFARVDPCIKNAENRKKEGENILKLNKPSQGIITVAAVIIAILSVGLALSMAGEKTAHPKDGNSVPIFGKTYISDDGINIVLFDNGDFNIQLFFICFSINTAHCPC